ncbi:hypothetical protein GCM10010342_21980 [Streptomyces anulatus]|nr:hypothetical protein GCM10010342_21980 [Streptomyces anulatus]
MDPALFLFLLPTAPDLPRQFGGRTGKHTIDFGFGFWFGFGIWFGFWFERSARITIHLSL